MLRNLKSLLTPTNPNILNRSIKILPSIALIGYCVVISELLLLFGVPLGSSSAASAPENEKTSFIIEIRVPAGVQSGKTDDYLCTATSLQNITEDAAYVEGFEYNFDKKKVHHFLLYGCKTTTEYFLETDYWPCNLRRKGIICQGRKQIPLGIPSDSNAFINSNATKTVIFPLNVAFGIGQKFDINFLLLEMHYVGGMTKNEGESPSGIKLHVTNHQPKYYGGMLTMTAVGFRIPKGREKYSVDINCQPKISHEIQPYAYWVHTHELGKVVSGYKVDKKTGTFTEIARWSHHYPQPVVLASEATDNLTRLFILPGDFLAARCTYNSSRANATVHWGRRRNVDEMCNLFIFYYTSSSNPDDLSLSCVNELSRQVTNNIPLNSDVLPEPETNTNMGYEVISTEIKSRGNESQSPICDLYTRFRIKNCPYG